MKRIIYFALILLLSNTISAQMKISGIIKDKETNLPLEFVTVSLLKEDSTIVEGVLSNEEGYFAFENIKKGANYILSTSYVGYEKANIVFRTSMKI